MMPIYILWAEAKLQRYIYKGSSHMERSPMPETELMKSVM